jgi:hypothetical protein
MCSCYRTAKRMRLCTARMSSDENVASLFRQPRPLSPHWTSHSICRPRRSLIRTAPVPPYGSCSISEMMPGHSRPRISLKSGIVCSYDVRLKQLPPRSPSPVLYLRLAPSRRCILAGDYASGIYRIRTSSRHCDRGRSFARYTDSPPCE